MCHGSDGQGAEGPALSNSAFLAAATDTFIMESIRRGRRGTAMPSFERGTAVHRALSMAEAESIVAFIRTWDKQR